MMQRIGWRRLVSGVAVGCALAGTAWGQWMTQEIPLREGWNAVYVRVMPCGGFEEELEEAVGSVSNVVGVWQWDRHFMTIETAPDGAELLGQSPHWKVWYPGKESFLNTLGGLAGGGRYLIRVRQLAGTGVLRIKGKAMLPVGEWYPNALNLVGVSAGPKGLSVTEAFGGMAETTLGRGYENGVYTIGADGAVRVVSRPDTQKLAQGEAVWVECGGASDYTGPVEVKVDEGGAGLEFGLARRTIKLVVGNRGTVTRKVALSHVASEEAPAGEASVLGMVPLYLKGAGSVGEAGWGKADGFSFELAPGEEQVLEFGVLRLEMEITEGTEGTYQSVLKVLDSEAKTEVDVPVTAERGPIIPGEEESLELPPTANAQAGLWMGEAVLTGVSCPRYQGNAVLPVRSPATVRLLVHVGADGTVRLLSEAWLAGGKAYARRELVPASATTGEVRRLSAVAFPLGMAPVTLGSDGLEGTLSGTVTVAFDDPVNPFLHAKHPQFDNKDGKFVPYAEGVETRTVTREVSMEVEAAADVLATGEMRVEGTYQEVVKGARADDVTVEGTVALWNLATGAELVTESAD